jgi:hypothetical protein
MKKVKGGGDMCEVLGRSRNEFGKGGDKKTPTNPQINPMFVFANPRARTIVRGIESTEKSYHMSA